MCERHCRSEQPITQVCTDLVRSADKERHVVLIILHHPRFEQRGVVRCVMLVHRSLDGRQDRLLGHRAGKQEALGGGRGAEGLVLLPVLLLACRSRGGGWALSHQEGRGSHSRMQTTTISTHMQRYSNGPPCTSSTSSQRRPCRMRRRYARSAHFMAGS